MKSDALTKYFSNKCHHYQLTLFHSLSRLSYQTYANSYIDKIFVAIKESFNGEKI